MHKTALVPYMVRTTLILEQCTRPICRLRLKLVTSETHTVLPHVTMIELSQLRIRHVFHFAPLIPYFQGKAPPPFGRGGAALLSFNDHFRKCIFDFPPSRAKHRLPSSSRSSSSILSHPGTPGAPYRPCIVALHLLPLTPTSVVAHNSCIDNKTLQLQTCGCTPRMCIKATLFSRHIVPIAPVDKLYLLPQVIVPYAFFQSADSGSNVDEIELEAIGGGKSNYVLVDNFAGLNGTSQQSRELAGLVSVLTLYLLVRK